MRGTNKILENWATINVNDSIVIPCLYTIMIWMWFMWSKGKNVKVEFWIRNRKSIHWYVNFNLYLRRIWCWSKCFIYMMKNMKYVSNKYSINILKTNWMSVPWESQHQKQIWTSVEKTKAYFEIHICIPIRHFFLLQPETLHGLHYESPHLIHIAQMFCF